MYGESGVAIAVPDEKLCLCTLNQGSNRAPYAKYCPLVPQASKSLVQRVGQRTGYTTECEPWPILLQLYLLF